MKFLTLIKANIKHQKGSFIGIFIMLMLISISITSVLSLNINSDLRFDEAIDSVGVGDLVYFINTNRMNESVESFTSTINSIDDVEKTECIKSVFGNCKINEYKKDNTTITAYNPEKHPYNVYNESCNGFLKNPSSLKDGEIYVPISYKNSCNCKIGDTIIIPNDTKDYSYTIKGFIEEPFVGGAVIGIKNIFVAKKDFDKMYNEIGDNSQNSFIDQVYIVNVYQKDTSTLTPRQFEQKINNNTNASIYSVASITQSASKNYTMLLNKIFSVILIAFVALLFAVSIIVISHSISTSIEMQYVNLGILKALGFTKRHLMTVIILQYLLAAIFGLTLGIPISIPVISYMNSILVPVTGLLSSNNIAFLPCIAILFGILLFIFVFIYLKTLKLSKITPISAISGGKSSVYFSSRLQMPIYKKCINFWIALRQFTSNIKQYVGISLISSIMVFFLTLVLASSSWISGEMIVKTFEPYQSDLYVKIGDKSISENDIDTIIKKYSDIKSTFKYKGIYCMFDGNNYFTYIVSNPKVYETVLSGRTCKYDNEIMITQAVADDLNKSIGDTVILKTEKGKFEYIVSGIFQSANDAGYSVAMNFDGAKLSGINDKDAFTQYALDDSSKTETILKEMKNSFGESGNKVVYQSGTMWDMENIINVAVASFSSLTYIIAALFVIITVALVCGKVIQKERYDSGALKAIGFTSKKLRLQFALRFLIASAVGGIFGMIFELFLKNQIMAMLLKNIGLVNVNISQTLFITIAPFIVVVVLFSLFAYILSRKIKKLNVSSLVTE